MDKTAPKTVADLMNSKVITVTESDTLEHLEESMLRLRFRHLPVVDGKKLVGLISHGDLLHASSSFLSDKAAERNALINKVTVSRIMQREVLTVRPEELLVEAGKMMWEAKVGCLPVTDVNGNLLGIITEADFIRLSMHLLGGDVNGLTPPPMQE